MARLILAALVAAAVALLTGVASKAIGQQSFWPGVIAAFVSAFSLFLLLSGGSDGR